MESMTRDDRPLSARLDAYVANLESIASQLEDVIPIVRPQDRGELGRSVSLYRLIAGDLTMIVNGEQLEPFRIEGTT